jgi:hypothetical protein
MYYFAFALLFIHVLPIVSFPYSFLFPTSSYFFKILTCTDVRTEPKRATSKVTGFLTAVVRGEKKFGGWRGRGCFATST